MLLSSALTASVASPNCAHTPVLLAGRQRGCSGCTSLPTTSSSSNNSSRQDVRGASLTARSHLGVQQQQQHRHKHFAPLWWRLLPTTAVHSSKGYEQGAAGGEGGGGSSNSSSSSSGKNKGGGAAVQEQEWDERDPQEAAEHDNWRHQLAFDSKAAFRHAKSSNNEDSLLGHGPGGSEEGHEEAGGVHSHFPSADVDGSPAGSSLSTYSFAKSNYPVSARHHPRIPSSDGETPKVYALPSDTLQHQVLRLEPNGRTRRFYVRRRDLLREHKLQPRDLRRIDPAIDFTKTSPSITVKENALLLCLGGVRCVVLLVCGMHTPTASNVRRGVACCPSRKSGSVFHVLTSLSGAPTRHVRPRTVRAKLNVTCMLGLGKDSHTLGAAGLRIACSTVLGCPGRKKRKRIGMPANTGSGRQPQ